MDACVDASVDACVDACFGACVDACAHGCRYAEERDKRLREDGSDQYIPLEGQLSYYKVESTGQINGYNQPLSCISAGRPLLDAERACRQD